MTWKLDKNSLKKLATVHPELQAVALGAAVLSPFAFAIVSGNRTQAEQNKLYAQGRTRKGNIVTYTRNSKHIGGRAVDFAAMDTLGRLDWNTISRYPKIAAFFKESAKALGYKIEWGGDWKWKDWGHVQLIPKGKVK